MIKRNARLCTLATVLFIGSTMNASTFICPKDNTMIAKQAEITGKYKSQRPAKKDRQVCHPVAPFSSVVESICVRVDIDTFELAADNALEHFL